MSSPNPVPRLLVPSDVQLAELLSAARRAADAAYCPYSNFHVGAAILAPDGRVFVGCNVENVSYGLTICAERSAACRAVTDGVRRFAAVAVCCRDVPGDAPPAGRSPCGACRQVLAEFCDPDTPVLIDGIGVVRMAELLPMGFAAGSLGRSRAD